MKKSITTNDTIAFCRHMEQMIENCGLFVKYDAAQAACLATEAWGMIAWAVKFHWSDSAKESASKAVAKFVDTIPQDHYYAVVMGDFLNDTYKAFTGKACKEA